MSLLTATNIRVRYNERVVLDDLSFTIQDRDRIGMVGRNGSGKSTFLRVLTGKQQPDSGEITGRKNILIGYLSHKFYSIQILMSLKMFAKAPRHILHTRYQPIRESGWNFQPSRRN